ncbi:Acetyltransferase (GNAT) domain-containing protein [Cyclobacterium lianum]|uniref:Acetyltransferase (GNAT) domain-containing protein n=1 Tax=Cyclobacterium lianum TaxID=388280 RepID=A0A1M7Q2E0_9BACT|nr:GNAT family N-acetyltransferase [Cyclobacterium lianum]SHN24395.1 Acetyltransferase (GNAT) domain-containing protein [Cyclobacterium lianum]
MMELITYQIENQLSVAEFREVLIASTLGERRPVENPARLEKMIRHANLIVTARKEGRLIGIARSLTDTAYCTYLSDLAVDLEYQKQGIGKNLIRRTKAAYPLAKLILLSAPKATGYYPKIGMSKHENCYYLEDLDKLT